MRLFRPVRRFASAINHLHGDDRMTETLFYQREKRINTMIVFSGVIQLTSGFASSVFSLNKSGRHDRLTETVFDGLKTKTEPFKLRETKVKGSLKWDI